MPDLNYEIVKLVRARDRLTKKLPCRRDEIPTWMEDLQQSPKVSDQKFSKVISDRESDIVSIEDKIKNLGFVCVDSPAGTSWQKVS